jgi:prevent-host-death family protein
MTTVTFTEFRNHATGMLNRVENGEKLLVIRHGRPIAEVVPAVKQNNSQPSWKRPGLRLLTKGDALSEVILTERDREVIS